MKKFFLNHGLANSVKEYNLAEMKIFYTFVREYKIKTDLRNEGDNIVKVKGRDMIDSLEKYNYKKATISDIIKKMPNKLYFINNEGTQIGFVAVFDKFMYDITDDTFNVVFTNRMMEHMDDLTRFAEMDLEMLKDISGKYAIRLYELYCSYKNQGFYLMKKEVFNKYFSIPESYKECDITKSVLNPAIKEMNRLNPGCVSVTKEKYNKKVTHYRFCFKDAKQLDQSSV